MLRLRAVPRPLLAQQDFFRKGGTLPTAARLALLRRLRLAVHEMEGEILEALHTDLGKSNTEAYLTEIALLYTEIRHMLRHL